MCPSVRTHEHIAPASYNVSRRGSTANYFQDNLPRMRYATFRAKGYFIGGRVVEGACKFIIARRFKQSGMRWTLDGFHRLLHLRLCIINNDWDRFARSYFPRVTAPACTYF